MEFLHPVEATSAVPEKDYAALKINLHERFSGFNGALDIAHKAEVPWVLVRFQVGASGSPTACHDDLAEDGTFHGSHSWTSPLLSDFHAFSDPVAQCADCGVSSTGSRFCP